MIPIPTQAEVLQNIYGVWRLARLDRDGLRFLDSSGTGLWKSFFAAVIVAPGFAILMAVYLPPEVAAAGALRLLAVMAIAYVLSWAVFPVVVEPICASIGKDERYALYIVAYNWAKVVQIGALLPIALITSTALLPPGINDFLNSAIYVLVVAYVWFISRSALDVGSLGAAGFVVLDIVSGEIIFAIALSLL